MPLEFWDEVILELVKTALSGVIVGLGWFVGERIVAYWDLRKKQQELDITVAREFQKLYGEFKDVSRLWRIYRYDGSKKNTIELPKDMPVDLLRRASAAEGVIEAMIVKLATERVLDEKDVRALGLFRQAYQKLREAIRDSERFEWTYISPQYHLYNDLAGRVARVVSTTNATRQANPDDAIMTLRRIVDVRPEEWDREVAAYGARPGSRS